jgi:repressor LexA
MLNERSRAILDFIKTFQREKGYPPTIREIGEAFDISSTNGVRYHLSNLVKGGHLSRKGRISRGTTSVVDGFPILGRVAAGQPILAEESYEGVLEPRTFFGSTSGMFALRVRGDSMIGAGILEGDYVLVRHQETAHAGDVVVGLIGDEATVKYYQPKGDRIELVAANPEYEPIVVREGAEFRLLGVVRGVIRTVGR